MKREKRTGPRTDSCGTSRQTKKTTFVILINHASAPVRKERLSPMSKARREASRNKFVEKGGMPDRVKSFREINSRQDRPRARPGFVKPIRNGLRKEQNLIYRVSTKSLDNLKNLLMVQRTLKMSEMFKYQLNGQVFF